ncbi:gdsl-like lipase acylhydrolase domain protein [Diplodia corticola]|uniref:Gdsl-like lipase acylhydrolase domain protein n=1 Tax=Diplodia corticola TaxID=236234 RepID=A0A1J9S6Q3_9PEZI|nr:gdsl-like lipase acylhydrolase domain protein [Diplodia corticola]OJD35620.1 gdsl-like lipase acylhydrolase domain protein [Diplodia corticola]
MRLPSLLIVVFLACSACATILQNGQVRDVHFPNTTIVLDDDDRNSTWRTYPPNATEIGYKGRWDSKHISWWSAPGLKFAFTGDRLAISFGQHTSPGVLIGYRLDGQDWQFTNVTANSTNLLVTPATPGFNLTTSRTRTFELRVTNWSLGVQIANIHVSRAANGTLVGLPLAPRTLEIIGDSLSAGQYATYEGLASYAWDLAAGLGGAEFSITAYPGICLVDAPCWGNARGQRRQWRYASDTSARAARLYGADHAAAEPWDFAARPPADVVVVNLGTNDNNTANDVGGPAAFLAAYVALVADVHDVWPDAQVVLVSLWNGFGPVGSSWAQGGAFVDEIQEVARRYESEGFVHYFNTTGIMQHNDIGPQWHPTDVGALKLASHLMQFIKIKFDWDLLATGPEIQHETLYWNDQANY